MVIEAQLTLPLDIIEATWLVRYPERMLSRSELIGLWATVLAKHAAHIEEMREKVTKEKIWRTLQLEKDLQHKIHEFDLKPESLVLVKNSAIEMLADRKIKPRYLGPMVVVRKLSVSKVRWPELSQLSLCSEFDKENLMEFSLNSLLLIHFTTIAMHLLSYGPHVTLVMWHTVTVIWPSVTTHHTNCDIVTKSCDTFLHSIL